MQNTDGDLQDTSAKGEIQKSLDDGQEESLPTGEKANGERFEQLLKEENIVSP